MRSVIAEETHPMPGRPGGPEAQAMIHAWEATGLAGLRKANQKLHAREMDKLAERGALPSTLTRNETVAVATAIVKRAGLHVKTGALTALQARAVARAATRGIEVSAESGEIRIHLGGAR